ncbi:CGNR zinc finger domain-containing protein [Catenulispora rubra]|uniref:CGNR zinc finger domain-containing protein n=1 Tax=Catenulispora rubra TaxID=280293 RepID=UPI002B27C143|nr:CGNR zinc finger domain-containing protein [Catenulispora rubra]
MTDLLNTFSAGKPRAADLLDDVAHAQPWLDEALACWSEETGRTAAAVELPERDLEELRGLRTELHRSLSNVDRDGLETASEEVPSIHVATVGLRLDRNGRVSLEPRGRGWRYVAALVMAEIFEAQQLDLWRRVKVCHYSRCGTTFYDRSRNNSGVWHSTRICGKAENLRAHRARQRGRAQ